MTRWIIPGGLLLAGVLAYRNSVGGPFIFDDLNTIVANRNLPHPQSLAEMVTAPTNTSASGRPLVQFTISLDYLIGGLHVGIYHATNLLIHLACGLALWSVLRRTLQRVPQLASRADALAGMSTLIWIVHPIQTGAVTYIVQRSECLASLMMLLTAYSFIRSVDSPRREIWWQGLSILACLAGMACKEMMVATPVLVFAYDRAFVTGSWLETIRTRCTFYLGLAATWLLLAALIASGPRAESAGFGIHISSLDYARTQVAIIAHYLRLVFWPRPLVLDYQWPLATSWIDVPIGLAIVVGGIAVATAVSVWRWPRWSVLGLWFLGVLAPTSSVVPLLDAAFEHRMYLPSAAIIIAVVVGMALIADRLRAGIVIGWVATALIVVTFIFMTNARNFDYRSSLAIWTDTVNKRPQNPRAHFNLSQAMEMTGDHTGAIARMRQAVDLDPNYFEAVEELGILLATHAAPQQAINYYLEQVANHPEWDGGWFNLGRLHQKQGDLAAARLDFFKVMEICPPGSPQNDAARSALMTLGVR